MRHALCFHQLTPETKGKEILVPLTSCMYVPGTVANSEKLLIEVGTGYYIERVSLVCVCVCVCVLGLQVYYLSLCLSG